MKKIRNGFTLVEIMIVVVIIALLAAIAIPNMLRSRQQAQEATAQANLKLIASALENYAAINSVYPTVTTALMGVTPPYLSSDYFTGVHGGYTYAHALSDYSYMIMAYPSATTPGTHSFTIVTGGIITMY
jgi:prepilin-type N-terminal cleavage/methylation domain-containing protein